MAKSKASPRRSKARRAARPRAAKKPASGVRRAGPTRRARPKGASRRKPARKSGKPPAGKRAPKPAPRAAAPAGKPSVVDRSRRQLPESERSVSRSGLPDQRLISSARAGHDELRTELARHTETSPELTAGDVDAKWEDAYAVGDEAPGGDNPTPDQDRVDDIGKALGIEYRDDEELQGGDEVTERDKHRWELDPESSDDWPHEE